MHRPLILIVDDESKIRRLLAQNLGKLCKMLDSSQWPLET